VEVGDRPDAFRRCKNRAPGDVPNSEFERTSRLQAKTVEARDSCRARARALRKDLYSCDLGIDLLALMCQDDDLIVEFARVHTVSEDQKMEQQNAAIASGRKLGGGNEHVSERFRRLPALYRKPDGGEWGGQDLENAAGGGVTRSYVANLKKGRIENPGLSKLETISKAMGFPPAL
jgi:hypothetical protein